MLWRAVRPLSRVSRPTCVTRVAASSSLSPTSGRFSSPRALPVSSTAPPALEIVALSSVSPSTSSRTRMPTTSHATIQRITTTSTATIQRCDGSQRANMSGPLPMAAEGDAVSHARRQRSDGACVIVSQRLKYVVAGRGPRIVRRLTGAGSVASRG